MNITIPKLNIAKGKSIELNKENVKKLAVGATKVAGRTGKNLLTRLMRASMAFVKPV